MKRKLVVFGMMMGGVVLGSEKTEVSFTWENDTFLDRLGFDYVDRHYTQGAEIEVWLRDNELQVGELGFVGSKVGWEWLGDWGMEVERTRGWVSLGQESYTPQALGVGFGGVSVSPTADQLQVDDRPYAGYLFVEVGWERRGRTRFGGWLSVPTRDRVIWTAGVVGPAALGEEAQSWWHEIFDGVEPEGWRFQLDNEPVVNVAMERLWLLGKSWANGMRVDVMPMVGFDAGTVRSALNVGLEGRVGMGEIGEFLLPSMGQGGGFGWYVYAGAEGNLVARDIFLDGNTFSSSHEVDRAVAVGEIRAGIGVQSDSVEARLGWARRSVEFSEQDIPNQYLSGTLTFKF
ncbi:MAG: lipid A deacylase LpxR family protein [Verrucomicrobiota bacterium]